MSTETHETQSYYDDDSDTPEDAAIVKGAHGVEDSFASLLDPVSVLPKPFRAPKSPKPSVKANQRRSRPSRAPLVASNNPSLRPSGRKRREALAEAARLAGKKQRGPLPKSTTSLSSFLPVERTKLNSATISNELRSLYWHLGKARTFPALLSLLRHYPHLSQLTLAEVQDMATRYKWDPWLNEMDTMLDSRLSSMEIEKSVKCVTDLRDIASEMISRFKTRMTETPEYCIINKPADLMAVARVLMALADRNPDGTKKLPGQQALGVQDSVRSGMTALGDATGRLISGLSETDAGRKILDTLGGHLKAVAQGTPDSEALEAEFEPLPALSK